MDENTNGNQSLRLAPIHLIQPKSPLVPDYGYYDRPTFSLSGNFCPKPYSFAYYSYTFGLSTRRSRFAFVDEVSVSTFRAFLSVFAFLINSPGLFRFCRIILILPFGFFFPYSTFML